MGYPKEFIKVHLSVSENVGEEVIAFLILTWRMVNKSGHSPLAALTSCLNKPGGDMMSPSSGTCREESSSGLEANHE
jgi:hypothetical protein